MAEVLNRRIDIRRVGERSEAAGDFRSRHAEWTEEETHWSTAKKTDELRKTRTLLTW
jgi:hypothetical protein